MTKQQHFANVIRKARKDSGLSQREFAKALGIKNSATICEWEAGKHTTYIVRTARIIRALEKFGVTIDDVAG